MCETLPESCSEALPIDLPQRVLRRGLFGKEYSAGWGSTNDYSFGPLGDWEVEQNYFWAHFPGKPPIRGDILRTSL